MFISKNWFLLVGIACSLSFWHFGLTFSGLAGALFLAALVVLALIDAKTFLLPDVITLPLLVLGFVVNAWGVFVPTDTALVGALLGYSSLWCVNRGFKWVRGQEGMGHGDFKLLAAEGAWLGRVDLPDIILIAACLAVFFGFIRIVFGKADLDTPLPFGPFLAIGGAVVLLSF